MHGGSGGGVVEDGGQDQAQENLQPLEDEAEIVADGGQHGVGVAVVASAQEVPSQVAVRLHVADRRLDGGTSSEFFLDLAVDAAPLRQQHVELVADPMASMTHPRTLVREGVAEEFFPSEVLEVRVLDPARAHPLRLIREIVNDVLGSLSADFAAAYSPTGRPSIPPERLVRVLLLQAFYSIRSERQLMEQLDFNLLFRWFVGLGIDDAVWDASTFCKNRDHFLDMDLSARVLHGIIEHKRVRRLLSRDHFSIDGTLIEAWASMKSFRRKDGDDGGDAGSGRNGERDFRGEKRSNATHASATDPEARLYRKGNGRESRLCYMDHALMENRHGLVVGGGATLATGTAEREAAQDADRRAHHAAPGLCRQPAYPQADRGNLRLGQGPGRSGQDQIPRPAAGRGLVHPGARRLQPDPVTPAAGGAAVSLSVNHAPFIGRWRLVHMDEWDRAYLDLVEEAYIAFDENLQGEFVFGVIQGWLDCRYGEQDGLSKVEFSWDGDNEGDPCCGRGWAIVESEKEVSGHLFIHCADDSYFEAYKL